MEAGYWLVLAFTSWTFLLLLVLGAVRNKLVFQGQMKLTGFGASSEAGSTLAHRVGRAHANCNENLPLVLGVVFYAYATAHSEITNHFACLFMLLRIGQSVTHIISVRAKAILLRFAFFVGQCAIMIYWLLNLWLA